MDNFTDFNLHSNISKAIEACGYTKPTPVQAKSIPQVLMGKDVVVSAQTGTGKTAAFVLPALHNLSAQEPNRKTRVLILTPTRELAAQITKAASLYGKFMRFNIVSLVGGMPYPAQIRDLSRGADIIVATPGRLMDHMDQKRIDLSNVEMLVLDEADRMLDMGFIDDVQYIAKLTPSKRQTLLFSATMDSKLMNAVSHLLKSPVRIDLSNEKLASPQIKQEMYKANNAHHKTRLLKHFLRDVNIYKAIIFSATKINADRLADQLCDDGFAAAALHGDLRQNVRTRTLDQLRRGKIQYLVATDVAARGIDISDITHVFNYDLPRFCEDYVHRIGRTGRAGKTGVAISFVLPTDARNIKAIERYLGQRIQVIQSVDMNDSESGSSSPKKYDSDEVLSLRKDASLDDERPRRSHGSDRERTSFKSDRGERSFRSDRSERPERSFRPDRGERTGGDFKSERGERTGGGFRSERSERTGSSFKSDRGERTGGGFRSERSERTGSGFKSDRGERTGSGFRSDRSERPERSFRPDRGERTGSGFKSDRSERTGSGFRSERGERTERSFSSDRSEKPKRDFKPEFTKKEGYKSKSKLSSDDQKSWSGEEKRVRKTDDTSPRRSKFSGDSDKRSSKKSRDFDFRRDKKDSGASARPFKKFSDKKRTAV